VRRRIHRFVNATSQSQRRVSTERTLVVLVVVEEAGDLLSQCKGLIFFAQRCGPLEQHSLYVGG
jgi:hypothetical protein